MKRLSRKLLVAIALPAILMLIAGLGVLWRATDQAVRAATQEEAVSLAGLVASSFQVTEEPAPGTPARGAHKAVTQMLRQAVPGQKRIAELRVLGRDGTVRWSKRIEEEDKVLVGAERLLSVGPNSVRFEQPPFLPWLPGAGGRGGEVLLPLGGVACAGCHLGETTMRSGVLQLTIEERTLRGEVAEAFLSALRVVVLLVLVLTLATLVSLRVFITRPLSALAEAMHKAQDGDLLVRAKAQGSEEIVTLAHAFNQLLSRLTTLKAEEIDHQRDMDEARTELELKAELEKTNGRLKERITELDSLYEVARSLTATLEPDEVLARVVALVPSKLGVPKCSVMLRTGDGQLEVRRSLPKGGEGLLFAAGEGICGLAATTRKAAYVPDIGSDPRFKVHRGEAKGRGSLLAVPMVHGAELLGVLNFERPQAAAFEPEEIEFFMAVADQVAMALQNARLHAKTVALAITDPLTGVPNRRYLFQQLEQELNRANRFGTQLSVLMIDIDFFKRLNDTAGHQAGDDVLRQVCALLKGMVRRVDTLGRYGGEEFMVLLPQVTRAEAIEVADKLRAAVATATFSWREVQPDGRITISVGVASLPGDATEQDRLVDCADAALYASKREGRNRVSAYAPGMERHPGRERGPQAEKRRITGEIPVVVLSDVARK